MDCKCKSIDKCIGTEKIINCKKLVETVETAETAETAKHLGFDAWLDDMEEKEQPTCNIENQEDCENCGS